MNALRGIFFVSRPPTAHFFAAGIPWNERQSSKFDIGGNFYVQQQRSVRLPEQQLVVDRHSDPPVLQLRRLERLREQQQQRLRLRLLKKNGERQNRSPIF